MKHKVEESRSREVEGLRKMMRQIAVEIPEDVAKQIDRAIAFSGQTEQEFVLATIVEKLNAIAAEVPVLELSDRDMDALLAAIENPPPPNEAMLRAMARWRELGSP